MQARHRIWAATIAAFAALLWTSPLSAQIYDERGWYMHGGWGGMLLGGLLMVVFWGVIIGVIVLIVRWLVALGGPSGHPHRQSPLEVLQERYARGEIDKEEYEERKAVLIRK